MADRRGAVLHRLATGSIALVGCLAGISSNKLDLDWFDRELLGGDLKQRRLDALPELRFAGKHRDATRIDADPRIKHRGGPQASRQPGRLGLVRRLAGRMALCRSRTRK